MNEIPRRSVIDFKAALGELDHQPGQREGAVANAPRKKNRVLAGDRFRLAPAHLPGARLPVT